MTDMRPWAKIDVGYMTNPKTYALRNALSNASSNAGGNAGACALALCMHVSSILYASQHRTDGHVPIELMKALNQGEDEQVEALAEVGMWHLEGHDCPDCPSVSPGQAYVHDFLDHNTSAKDATEASEKARRAAHARWNAPSNAPSNANRMPKEKRREEKNKSTDSSGKESTSKHSARFDEFWDAYPKRVGKKDAEKKFAKAVKDGVDPQEIIDGANTYAEAVKGTEPQFIAHPTTWLNQGRWEDEPTANTQEEVNYGWNNPLPRANAH